MGALAGCLIYLVLWWIVLFAVLPWGIKPSPDVQLGHDTGAPHKGHLRLKMIITTLLAACLWFLVDYLISIRWIPLAS